MRETSLSKWFTGSAPQTRVIALYDHEEVGSRSAAGGLGASALEESFLGVAIVGGMAPRFDDLANGAGAYTRALVALQTPFRAPTAREGSATPARRRG